VATPDQGIASMMHRNPEPCTNAVGLPIYYEVGRQLWEREGVNDEIRAWKVFDGHGRLLGAVDIPARLYVLAIERGYVITLSTGKNDVEVVELYRLDKRTED
jgi:hypothetical protein